MTLSRTMAEQVNCECSDPGCKAHKGISKCEHQATDILFRVDMQDETGTAMCDECSDDAFSSGLFTTQEEDSCSKCGESTDDGEGYDGLCGNCADKKEGAM